MDFEEEWRLALLDHNGPADDMGADDEFDAELLQSAPYAHDAVPDHEADAGTLGTFNTTDHAFAAGRRGLKGVTEAVKDHQSGVFNVSALLDDVMDLDGSVDAAPENKATVRHCNAADADYGVCFFPPLNRTSFMVRGDGGTVRWVTASGLETASKRESRQRRRLEAPPHGGEEAGSRLPEEGPQGGGPDTLCERGRVDVSSSEEDEGVASGHHDRLYPPSSSRGHLLSGPPIHILLEQVHEDAARARAHQLQQPDEDMFLANAELNGPFTGPSNTPRHEVPHDRTSAEAAASSDNSELWVSKYIPQHFRDLLSDDSTNLQLLQWMKSWDPFVFGVAASVGGRTSGSTAVTSAGKDTGNNDVSSHPGGGPSPPEHRLAVLTGPPGVGKTILVHVLAAHCGYEVIEVNASVERTVSRLEALIKTAVSSTGTAPARRVVRRPPVATAAARVAEEVLEDGGTMPAASLIDHLRRPKCLVLDEIDGLAANVAPLLLKLDIHRPVFCLCNNFYQPSLRVLRQQCQLVFHLPPLRPQRLLSRLEEIAAREGMAIDQPTLVDLVRTSGGDIRSCLNTMQFLQAADRWARRGARHHLRVNGDAGMERVAPPKMSASEIVRRIQHKDARGDVWGCWQTVFNRLERAKAIQSLKKETSIDYEALMEQSSRSTMAARRKREREPVVGNPLSPVGQGCDANVSGEPATVALGFKVDPGYLYATHLLDQFSHNGGSSGGGSILVDGLQENYLRRPYVDYGFAQTLGAADTLSTQDVLHHAAYTNTQSLIGFVNRFETVVTAAKLYVCCSSAARGDRPTYPTSGTKLSAAQMECIHVVQSFREGCRLEVCAHLTSDETVATEVGPLLLWSLFDGQLRLPAHGAPSLTSLPHRDQLWVQSAAVRHIQYGLTYRPSRRTDGEGGSYAQPRPRDFPAREGGDPAVGAGRVHWVLTPALDELGGGRRTFTSQGMRQTSSYVSQPHQPHGKPATHSFPSSTTRLALSTPFAAADASASSARQQIALPVWHIKDSVRELLVGEIQRQRILVQQHQATGERPFPTEGTVDPTIQRTIGVAPPASTVTSAPTVAKAAVLPPTPSVADVAVCKDFFGRIIRSKTVPSSAAPSSEAGSNHTGVLPPPSAVRYVYHDGSTNAVKMPAAFVDF